MNIELIAGSTTYVNQVNTTTGQVKLLNLQQVANTLATLQANVTATQALIAQITALGLTMPAGVVNTNQPGAQG